MQYENVNEQILCLRCGIYKNYATKDCRDVYDVKGIETTEKR